MARVDMFLTPAGEIYVNEINTLPGFTNISMYPQLWGDAGIGYTALIRKLLDLAIARYDQRKKLKTTWRA
jgi:D-alanine-D-alanine ligase